MNNSLLLCFFPQFELTHIYFFLPSDIRHYLSKKKRNENIALIADSSRNRINLIELRQY